MPVKNAINRQKVQYHHNDSYKYVTLLYFNAWLKNIYRILLGGAKIRILSSSG